MRDWEPERAYRNRRPPLQAELYAAHRRVNNTLRVIRSSRFE
jgi:hypothetical protein